ncbi:MAG: PEP-CTERM sorting domain-containing protein [Bryobacteraceae bacterium]
MKPQPVTAFGLWFGNDDSCCSTGFDAVPEAFDTNASVGSVSLTANLDDVQFNSAVDEVPEPSTFLLGASSLAALIALRRRHWKP